MDDDDDVGTTGYIIIGVILGGFILLLIFVVGTLLKRKYDKLSAAAKYHAEPEHQPRNTRGDHGGYLKGTTPPPSYSHEQVIHT